MVGTYQTPAAAWRGTRNRFALAVQLLVYMEGEGFYDSFYLTAAIGATPGWVRQLLGRLARAGLLRVKRGPGGGWSLARPSHRITVAQVFDALEGRTAFPLLSSPHSVAVLLDKAASAAANAFRSELAGVTIYDLARAEVRRRPLLALRAGMNRRHLTRIARPFLDEA